MGGKGVKRLRGAEEGEQGVDLIDSAVTLTYGEVAENHVRMQKLGKMAEEGLTKADLDRARERFEALGCEAEVLHLNSGLDGADYSGKAEDAYLLVARGGAAALLRDAGFSTDSFFMEQTALNLDKVALMRGRVVNKRARYNLCFADEAQEPNVEEGKGRVVAFGAVGATRCIRERLPDIFGAKAAGLYAEGNYYYDPQQCGIGFHGDAERRIVIAVRLGASIPLHYQWFQRSAPIGDRIAVSLNHGDMYAMSHKAAGTDWLQKVVPTLRHAAGCQKYLATKAAPKKSQGPRVTQTVERASPSFS